MIDPYKILGPTCVSFSGGRSSAFMLKRVIESNDGLPQDAMVLFCNTGKEEEATLNFVNECSVRWGVEIIWLEYRFGGNFSVVDFNSASRKGRPFDDVIKQRYPSLPNGRSRYCSSEMKTRTMHRYLKSIGWEEWDTFLGIRSDEPRRVSKFMSNPSPEGKHEEVFMPMAYANVSSEEVNLFWSENEFDLHLPVINGKTMHGNCDLCFLKPEAQIFSLIKEKPEKATWWINHELQASERCSGDGQYFAIDRPTYSQMLKFSKDQVDMFDENKEGIDCFCGD